MIRLKNLERRYPLGKEKFFYVLRDINLEIAEGEFVSIMGPSGAGKSTLLHILGMHDHGWEGEYFLNETAVHHLKPKERATLRNEQIGFVFQQYHLLDDLTRVREPRYPVVVPPLQQKRASCACGGHARSVSNRRQKRFVSPSAIWRTTATGRRCEGDHRRAEASARR